LVVIALLVGYTRLRLSGHKDSPASAHEAAGISETKERDCNCAPHRCALSPGRPVELINANGELKCANGNRCTDAAVDALPKPYCPQEAQRLQKSTARASWAPGGVGDALSKEDAAASEEGLDLVMYAQYAIEVVERMKEYDWYFQTNCPKSEMIGTRPPRHPNWMLGGRCEAWQTRYSVMLQNMVTQPSMHALEWSSGASTFFELGLVGTLTSVENYSPWLDTLRKKLPPSFAKRWTGVAKGAVAAIDPAYAGFLQKYGPEHATYGTYIEAPPTRKYDVVSIDAGRVSIVC
jgi:hypothetical protein